MSTIGDWLAKSHVFVDQPERVEAPAKAAEAIVEGAEPHFDRKEATAALDALEAECERFLGRRQGRIPVLLADLRSMLS